MAVVQPKHSRNGGTMAGRLPRPHAACCPADYAAPLVQPLAQPLASVLALLGPGGRSRPGL